MLFLTPQKNKIINKRIMESRSTTAMENGATDSYVYVSLFPKAHREIFFAEG